MFKTALASVKAKSQPKKPAIVAPVAGSSAVPVQRSYSSPIMYRIPSPSSVPASLIASPPSLPPLASMVKHDPFNAKSDGVVSAPPPLSVVGVISGYDEETKKTTFTYLLSDGRSVKSKKKYQQDDLWKG